MADKTKNVYIDVSLKDKASTGLKNVGTQLTNVGTKADEASKKSGALSGSMKSLSTSLLPVAGAATLVYLQFKKLQASMEEAIKLYGIQIDAEAELRSSLGFTSDALTTYAGELQKVTTYGDEAIISSMAQVGAFIKDEAQIKLVTKAALDLSAAKKISLKSATDLLVKSIVTSTNALKDHGIQIKDGGTREERLKNIVEGVNKAFGGRAAALAKTDMGKLLQVEGRMSDQQETLGKELIKSKLYIKEFQEEINKYAIPALLFFIKGNNLLIGAIKGNSIEAKKYGNIISTIYSKMGDEDKQRVLADDVRRLSIELEKQQKIVDKMTWSIYVDEETPKLNRLKEKLDLAKGALSQLNDEIKAKANLDINAKAIEDAAAAAEAAKKASDAAAAAEAEYYKFSKEAHQKNREEQYADAQARMERYIKDAAARMQLYDNTLATEASHHEMMISKKEEFDRRYQEFTVQSTDDRIEVLRNSYADELSAYEVMLEEKYISQEQFNSMSEELTKDQALKESDIRIEAFQETSNTITGIASTLMDGISSINSLVTENQTKDLDKETEAKKLSAKNTITNKRQLERELEKIDADAAAKKEEYAKNDKKIAMIMSIINTAQAVTAALTMKPTPLGIGMSILVGTLGAIQTGLIASQAFAGGGFVKGDGSPSSGDKVNIRANPGEAVFNQTQQQNLLWNLATQRQTMESMSLGGDTYIVQGNLDSTAVGEIRKMKEDWLQVLRASNKELARRGYQYAY